MTAPAELQNTDTKSKEITTDGKRHMRKRVQEKSVPGLCIIETPPAVIVARDGLIERYVGRGPVDRKKPDAGRPHRQS
jgi:hypothetical protein